MKTSNLLPVRLLCAAGFLFHLGVLIYQIQNDQLVINDHIDEVNLKWSPEFLFCFDFDQSLIDRNRSLTGDYLEQLTSHMTVETVFRRIRYLNDRSEWNVLNESDPTNDERMRVETVFLYEKKCFKISNPILYEPYQFLNLDEFEEETYFPVLRIDLNRSFIEKRKLVLFSRNPNEMHTSDSVHLNSVLNGSYSFRIVSMAQTNNDKFSFIKFDSFRSPLSLLYDNDVHRYFTDLKGTFRRRYNATTRELPLEPNEFSLQINDTLFRQHYYEVQYPRDKSMPGTQVFERQIFWNSFSFDPNSNDSDFVFLINFFKIKKEFRNGENLAKLILNLLNAFSLWGLNIFSMFVFKFNLFNEHSIRRRIRRFFSISKGASGSGEGGTESVNTSHPLQARIERRKSRSENDIWISSMSVDEGVDHRRPSMGKRISQSIDVKRSRFRERTDFNQTVEF